MEERALLARAAAHFRIEPEYIDTWGRHHASSEESQRLVLAALGAPPESDGLHSFLEDRDAAQWRTALDPTLVVREGAIIALRIPAERSGASVKLEIQWEDGELQHRWFWLPELATSRQIDLAGSALVEKRVHLPPDLRLGYHTLRVYWVNAPQLELFGEARMIVCPGRAHVISERVAGVAISLYGLRSSRNWGCGDLTDLLQMIDVCARAGAAFVALNPVHAIANRQPYNTSPYLPQNILYRNFLYLDVEKVTGFEPDDTMPEEIQELRCSELVEYERVARLKLRALEPAFERFLNSGGGVAALDSYDAAEGRELHDFAVYCALDEEMHRRNPDVWVWTQWPVEFQDPGSPAVQEFAAAHRHRIRFFKFLQWQLDLQFAQAQEHARRQGMKIGLYHDWALATDRFGSDLWANRRFYVSGCRVGAPPDELAPSGQDWGFLPPNREEHRADAYRRFVQTIRNSARHGGALRIDHVMRLFRLYWIPDPLSATQGVYVRDLADDLLGILALESVRQGFIVVGEDLGTVAPEIRHRLSETGIFGYRVLWFERNGDGSFRAPHEYPAQAAVTTTTHDLPTLAGFFTGRDIEARRAAGLVDEEAYRQQWEARDREIHRLREAMEAAGFPGDPLGFVLSTPCALAIINQEDLTGEPDQQNLPASTWQHPNWRRKMRVAVDQTEEFEQELKQRLQRSGRASTGSNP